MLVQPLQNCMMLLIFDTRYLCTLVYSLQKVGFDWTLRRKLPQQSEEVCLHGISNKKADEQYV